MRHLGTPLNQIGDAYVDGEGVAFDVVAFERNGSATVYAVLEPREVLVGVPAAIRVKLEPENEPETT